jgi:TldD protein
MNMILDTAGVSRRRFLTSTTCALTGASLALGGMAHPRPVSALTMRRPVHALFPAERDPGDLRAIAQAAIDAARAAGASFADIRVGDSRMFDMSYGGREVYGWVWFGLSYGLRVCVNGHWSFVYGIDPTPERVATSAQALVRSLRASAASAASPSEFALPKTPVVHGEWETPLRIDPFTASPDDHAGLLVAIVNAVLRVPGATTDPIRMRWSGETRVFASSEGTLTTQRLVRMLPHLWGDKIRTRDGAIFREGGANEWSFSRVIPAASGGLELLTGPALQERLKAFTETQSQWNALPVTHQFPVGRYNTVFDGNATAGLLLHNVVPSLALDRALGLGGYGHRQSAFSPDRVPGLSPELTLRIDRTAPTYGAARWDDEGVAAQTVPVITKGVITEYICSRTTAAALHRLRETDRVRSTDVPIPAATPRGTAVAATAQDAPVDAALSVRMTPDASRSREDLIRMVGSGVLVAGSGFISPNDTLTTGLLRPLMAFEVKGGRVTRRILDSGIQYATVPLCQKIVALGGPSTVEGPLGFVWREDTPEPLIGQAFAPATLIRDVTVVDLGWRT